MLNKFKKFYTYYLSNEIGFSWMFYLLVISIVFITPILHFGILNSIIYNFILTFIFILSIRFEKIKESIFYKFLIGFTLINFLFFIVELFYTNKLNDIMAQLISIVFILFVIIHYVVELFKDKQVTFRRIQGGIIIYLLIGVIYFKIYFMLYMLNTSNFIFHSKIHLENIQMNLFYFSFTTLTTVGFGDIAANSPITKPIVITEALIGQLYPVIFLARLVSLEIEMKKQKTFYEN